MVTAGEYHTCALLSTGNITCWGDDYYGQLGNGAGNGDIEAPPAPITLPGTATAIAITAGWYHTCALLNDGNITCWGEDSAGQLGNGVLAANIDTPPAAITLPNSATATAIAAGGIHTCALLNDGNITCWGWDNRGQLGNGPGNENIDTPPAAITLPNSATAIAIAAGAYHTCALLNDGNITCWGYDGNGQLGNGPGNDSIDTPPAAITLPNSATATAITAGADHTCALLNDGNITCWGRDCYGQLGNGAGNGDIDAPPAPIELPEQCNRNRNHRLLFPYVCVAERPATSPAGATTVTGSSATAPPSPATSTHHRHPSHCPAVRPRPRSPPAVTIRVRC